MQWCTAYNQIITNIWLPENPRRLCACGSPVGVITERSTQGSETQYRLQNISRCALLECAYSIQNKTTDLHEQSNTYIEKRKTPDGRELQKQKYEQMYIENVYKSKVEYAERNTRVVGE